MKSAVVLLNLGGPDSLEAVQPFLFNLFCDKDIFKIPFGQRLFASIISKRRAPKIVKQYDAIGGKSPIAKWTELQRNGLETALRAQGHDASVFTAMRYWNPLTKETAAQVAQGNYDSILLLPLYPHFSISTTGSSFNEWNRCFTGDSSRVTRVDSFFKNPLYIKSLNSRIDEALETFPDDARKDVVLVFSAHGTPVSLVKNGDPYSLQIQQTVKHVMEQRNNSHAHRLCYQSKVGPVKWLEPATETMIRSLASEGAKHLLIIPISFVSDHLETLFELGVEYRHSAKEAGIVQYTVMTGLNDSSLFIQALTQTAINALTCDIGSNG